MKIFIVPSIDKGMENEVRACVIIFLEKVNWYEHLGEQEVWDCIVRLKCAYPIKPCLGVSPEDSFTWAA